MTASQQAWRIESAGTWTMEGHPAASLVRAVLKEKGLDLARHRSRVVTSKMIHSFNLILTMERGHKEALQAEFRDCASRVFLLSEMVGKIREIRDPMGGAFIDFQETAHEISDYLEQGYEEICRRAGMDVKRAAES